MPNNSNITTQGNTSIITGGTRAGRNLFHSFSEFSVPTKGVAYFNNSSDIQNILSRVTGSSISNIDGLIKANGAANLFLINPNGVIFGPNASLNIGGSFIGTTASSLKFADGTQFSAAAPQDTALLTISVPLGLQFGPRPGEIHGQGPGAVRDPDTTLLLNRNAGLRVQPNQTLALVGGNLSLEGSVITTDGGRIELGSVTGSSFVNLTPIGKGWSLGYEGVQNFQDIKLSHEAAVDASGRGGGDIQVQGRNVMITDGSQIEASTVGSQAGGTLAVAASQSIDIMGTSPNGFHSGIFSDVYSTATGTGDTLIVQAGQLAINDGGIVETGTRGQGNGGNLVVNVPGRIEVGVNSPSNTSDGLIAFTSGAGNAGGITILTGDLILANGGQVNTSTLSQGRAGDLLLHALNSVQLIGSSQHENVTGLVSEAYRGSTGEAGNITVKTGNLVVNNAIVGSSSAGLGQAGNITITTGDLLAIDGGQLQAATGGPGQGGNLTVDASGLVDLRGTTSSGFPSGLLTTTQGSGNAGNLTISAANFKVSGGAVVSAYTSAQGNGGNISLHATHSVDFSGIDPSGFSSGLFATTYSGIGNAGNISVNSNTLRLANGAVVSALTTATAKGDSGKITINANTFEADNGGQILTATFGSGKAENIIFNVPNSATFSNSDTIFTSNLAQSGKSVFVYNGSVVSGLFANTAPGSTGEGGGIISVAPTNLTLTDGSTISVGSLGTNKAGNLNIQAGTINLDRRSSITATTASSQGGNINLQAQNLLLLRHGSQISATAGTAKAGGDGGNITIKAPLLVAVPSEKSNITANAYTGRGGKIDITAKGIFGFQSKDRDLSQSQISASSDFGINGTLRLNIPDVDLARVTTLAVVQPQAPQFYSVCQRRDGGAISKLVNTGTGGIPATPLDPQSTNPGWNGTSSQQSSQKPVEPEQSDGTPAQIVEAQGWIRNPDGRTVSFTTEAPGVVPYSSLASPPCPAAEPNPHR